MRGTYAARRCFQTWRKSFDTRGEKMFWNCFRFLSYNRSTRTLIAATRARLTWASQGNLPYFARRPVVEARTTNCEWAFTYQFSIHSANRLNQFKYHSLNNISHSCQKDIVAGCNPETITVFFLLCFSIISIVYFGGNNSSNVLKSLNIGMINI